MKQQAVRRRIEFDPETWHALDQLGLESGKRLQDLAEEAFRDLLKKYRRPITLRDACEKACACSLPTIAPRRPCIG